MNDVTEARRIAGWARADSVDPGRQCPKCGETRTLLFVFPKGTRVYGGCRCALTRDARAAQGEAMAVLRERLEAAGVDPALRFGRSGFQEFVTDENPEAWKIARAWAATCSAWMNDKGPRPKKGVGFIGRTPGTGKSHLAASIVRHILRRHDARVRCHVETEAIRELRDSWRRDSGTRPANVFTDMTGARLILWDDWMAGISMDEGMRFDIVDSWRQAQSLVVLTSNYSKAEMRKALKSRTFSRLNALVEFVPMRGTRDWRGSEMKGVKR